MLENQKKTQQPLMILIQIKINTSGCVDNAHVAGVMSLV